ncbi:hypothetical protein [Mesorhizobium sp. Z1-4]|uniref:hypothetical protein n=1 Tax=Mesorhizobium sp. Z1-4 TaxID=2448478 RepID=UPI000FD70F65|nr:hypothetical protein [Mesorhizobium sp. Z1-4]
MLGNIRAEPVLQPVLNPDWRPDRDGEKAFPRYVTAAVNIRESSISALLANNAITASQHAAAEKFRTLFEAMGASGAKGLDTTREFVDGGTFPEPIGQKAIDAGKKLASAHHALVTSHGLYAWRLVGYICGEGRTIRELAETRRQRDTMTDNLRAYLDVLAAHWGYSTVKKRA